MGSDWIYSQRERAKTAKVRIQTIHIKTLPVKWVVSIPEERNLTVRRNFMHWIKQSQPLSALLREKAARSIHITHGEYD